MNTKNTELKNSLLGTLNAVSELKASVQKAQIVDADPNLDYGSIIHKADCIIAGLLDELEQANISLDDGEERYALAANKDFMNGCPSGSQAKLH